VEYTARYADLVVDINVGADSAFLGATGHGRPTG
jgi:hypothetical protein